jgi:hypothetical protein
MLDQIRFTQGAFRLDTVEERYRRLLRDFGHDKCAEDLASAVLRFGQLDRGDVHTVLKTSERTARNVVSKMVQRAFCGQQLRRGQWGSHSRSTTATACSPTSLLTPSLRRLRHPALASRSKRPWRRSLLRGCSRTSDTTL